MGKGEGTQKETAMYNARRMQLHWAFMCGRGKAVSGPTFASAGFHLKSLHPSPLQPALAEKGKEGRLE